MHSYLYVRLRILEASEWLPLLSCDGSLHHLVDWIGSLIAVNRAGNISMSALFLDLRFFLHWASLLQRWARNLWT
jgi:hypothetical protein